MTSEQAKNTIGAQKETDYILAPLNHAKELPPEAGALAIALNDSQLGTLAQQYVRHDNEATAARDAYKVTLSRANLAVLAATMLGALMMAAQILAPAFPAYDSILRTAGMAAGIIAGIAASAGAMWLFKAREGQLLERWLGRRAKAEADRERYFAALAAAPDDLPLRLLKLEYFRRYQVDVQRNYFAERTQHHAKAAARTLGIGAWAVGVSSLMGFAGGAFGLLDGGTWTALGAVSVIAGALGAYAGAREAMSQDKRNAERYENALETLELLAAKLDEVRKAVADGNVEALKAFVSAVNEQLATEHRQWLEAGQGAKKAMETVEAGLASVVKGNPKQE